MLYSLYVCKNEKCNWLQESLVDTPPCESCGGETILFADRVNDYSKETTTTGSALSPSAFARMWNELVK